MYTKGLLQLNIEYRGDRQEGYLYSIMPWSLIIKMISGLRYFNMDYIMRIFGVTRKTLSRSLIFLMIEGGLFK